jgi:hypothetical protein
VVSATSVTWTVKPADLMWVAQLPHQPQFALLKSCTTFEGSMARVGIAASTANAPLVLRKSLRFISGSL